MAKPHRMTPARRAALKRAQAASARKRRGKGKGKLAKANRSNSRLRKGLAVAGTAAAIGAVAYTVHHNTRGKKMRVKAPKTDHVQQTIRDAAARSIPPGSQRGGRGSGIFGPHDNRHGSHGGVRSAHHHAQAFGLKTTKRKMAEYRLRDAAQGTKGRKPIAQPGGAVPHHPKTEHKKDPNARRMRIHHKLGLRGHYNAGLSHHGKRTIVATTTGASHRR
jgi:hypothetical protein